MLQIAKISVENQRNDFNKYPTAAQKKEIKPMEMWRLVKEKTERLCINKGNVQLGAWNTTPEAFDSVPFFLSLAKPYLS